VNPFRAQVERTAGTLTSGSDESRKESRGSPRDTGRRPVLRKAFPGRHTRRQKAQPHPFHRQGLFRPAADCRDGRRPPAPGPTPCPGVRRRGRTCDVVRPCVADVNRPTQFGSLGDRDWPRCGLHSPRAERRTEQSAVTPSAMSVQTKRRPPLDLAMLPPTPAPIVWMTGMMTFPREGSEISMGIVGVNVCPHDGYSGPARRVTDGQDPEWCLGLNCRSAAASVPGRWPQSR
jgi:hypothetical protein